MTKITVPLLLLLLNFVSVEAQKKKDLILEIDALKFQLDTTKQALVSARKNMKVSRQQVSDASAELEELRETNASLLKNLNDYLAVSSKKSETVNKALGSLEEKENQLKTITEELNKRDSLNIELFSKIKGAMGTNAKTGIQNGALYLSIPNLTLFGDNDKNYALQEGAKPILQQLANLLQTQPELSIVIEGNSNALEFSAADGALDNWDLSGRQAAAIAKMLEVDFEVNSNRLSTVGNGITKSESVVETVTQVRINPRFDAFHKLVKESLKNK